MYKYSTILRKSFNVLQYLTRLALLKFGKKLSVWKKIESHFTLSLKVKVMEIIIGLILKKLEVHLSIKTLTF